MKSISVAAAVLAAFLLAPLSSATANHIPQSPLAGHEKTEMKYPKIVLYSTSWCPHCKAAKEYLTSHNIPFINKDVELDDEAMQLLTGKYKSQGVPVIVFGDDAEVMRGFDETRFEKTVEKLRTK